MIFFNIYYIIHIIYIWKIKKVNIISIKSTQTIYNHEKPKNSNKKKTYHLAGKRHLPKRQTPPPKSHVPQITKSSTTTRQQHQLTDPTIRLTKIKTVKKTRTPTANAHTRQNPPNRYGPSPRSLTFGGRGFLRAPGQAEGGLGVSWVGGVAPSGAPEGRRLARTRLTWGRTASRVSLAGARRRGRMRPDRSLRVEGWGEVLGGVCVWFWMWFEDAFLCVFVCQGRFWCVFDFFFRWGRILVWRKFNVDE